MEFGGQASASVAAGNKRIQRKRDEVGFMEIEYPLWQGQGCRTKAGFNYYIMTLESVENRRVIDLTRSRRSQRN